MKPRIPSESPIGSPGVADHYPPVAAVVPDNHNRMPPEVSLPFDWRSDDAMRIDSELACSP